MDWGDKKLGFPKLNGSGVAEMATMAVECGTYR